MSEYINNVTRRKETLKSVLRQIHAGKTVEEVKQEFGMLAREASSSEIAEIEQMLIDEGLPAEEIQNLCDVHVAIFREGLEEERPAETVPGHPVHTFRAENEALLRFLDEMDRAFEQVLTEKAPVRLKTFCYQLEHLTGFEVHYLRKENLLFPYLEQYGFQGPSKVMWGIHDTIRAGWKKIHAACSAAGLDSLPQIADTYAAVSNAMREMVYKEEKILFPASMEHLKPEDWAAIRSQEQEFGHFLVTPGREWQPPRAKVENSPAAGVSPAGLLSLNTGALTLEQVNLMLVHLPVDVTFVDENDEVSYYSQTRERIFDRTPAIIGRKVQLCHPPQSVGRVQKILDDFRAGRRDSADFWIRMGGRMVYIRYFAMRDEGGRYRGTIEVTQDIAPIRALEGERRLLDE